MLALLVVASFAVQAADAPAVALAAAGVGTRAGPPAAVYNGRKQQLNVKVPRLEGHFTVDGVLDEPQWKQAAVLTGFSQYSPADGAAAADSTEVLVWYSATAIHFGIRAYEVHGAVHATLANRDAIDSDDYIQLLLSTFNDGRQAMLFGVNALGVQQDGIITEMGLLRGGSGFGSAGTVREAPDLNPDFVFQSKGRVTPWGYEVEVSIPFKTLKFQPKDDQTWGFQVIRKTQHNGHEDVWAPARRSAASFLSQSGRLVGLTDMHRGLVMDVTPEVTQHTDGAPAATGTGRWQYTSPAPDVGGTVRWGIGDNLTMNGTVKPDFSQVEADVFQLQYDPRRAVQYPEKRPFFLDGIEAFNVPNTLIYSRDIVQPTAAVRLTGKVSGTNVAYMSAVDGSAYSIDGAQPVFNILRTQKDFGGSSRLGFAYTDVIDGRDYNRVPEVDTRLVFNNTYSIQAQVAESYTKDSLGVRAAPMWYTRIDRNGRSLGLRLITNAISDSFVTRAGFVSRAGIGHVNGSTRYTFYGRPGSVLESLAPDASLDGTWTYESFMHAGEVQDVKSHFGLTGALRGGWQINGALLVENFGYDSTLYTTYRLLEPLPNGGTDTARFTGTPHLPNLDYSFSLVTPQSKYVDLAFNTIIGKDENFYEWSNANIVVGSATVNLRPSKKLRLQGIYKMEKYVRRTDGSTVGLLRVPRLLVEYQLTRSIFFRYVGQYTSQYVDALRDDSRTNDPIAICTTAGVCTRSVAADTNSFRSDWLFAYQPVPGTVFFLGYGATELGATALGAAPFQFRGLARQVDGFFIKGSYLIRM